MQIYLFDSLENIKIILIKTKKKERAERKNINIKYKKHEV
jgi:hypothetical protein